MQASLKLPRDPAWHSLRNQWLRDHPSCAACGGKKNLEVHHKVPVHVSRSMELDPTNLITLCEAVDNKQGDRHCHFTIGHLGNWYNYNRNVDKQAFDALQHNYPKPGQRHTAPVFSPVEPTADNPAKSASPEPTELAPVRFVRQRRRV